MNGMCLQETGLAAQLNYPTGTAGFTSSLLTVKGQKRPTYCGQNNITGGLMEDDLGVLATKLQHYQGMSFSGIVLNGKVHYTPRTTAHGKRLGKS